MLHFCIIFITILGLSVGVKLRLTEYGNENWITTSDTSNNGTNEKTGKRISCYSFNELYKKCGKNIYINLDDEKDVCCGIWETYHCVEKQAKGCSNEFQILIDLKSDQNEWERIFCKNDKRDETYCNIPSLNTLIYGIVSILIVVGWGFCVYKKCLNRPRMLIP